MLIELKDIKTRINRMILKWELLNATGSSKSEIIGVE